MSGRSQTKLGRELYLNDLVHLLAVPLISRSHIAFLVIWTSVAVWVGVRVRRVVPLVVGSGRVRLEIAGCRGYARRRALIRGLHGAGGVLQEQVRVVYERRVLGSVMGDAANTDGRRQPSRAQSAGVSSDSQRCRSGYTGGVAQGWGSSGNSHVVDLKGAEMDGDKAVELEHLGCEVPVLGRATSVDMQYPFWTSTSALPGPRLSSVV